MVDRHDDHAAVAREVLAADHLLRAGPGREASAVKPDHHGAALVAGARRRPHVEHEAVLAHRLAGARAAPAGEVEREPLVPQAARRDAAHVVLRRQRAIGARRPHPRPRHRRRRRAEASGAGRGRAVGHALEGAHAVGRAHALQPAGGDLDDRPRVRRVPSAPTHHTSSPRSRISVSAPPSMKIAWPVTSRFSSPRATSAAARFPPGRPGRAAASGRCRRTPR